MGKTILVTGAAGKLGMQISLYFASENNNLILVDKDLVLLNFIKEKILKSFSNITVETFEVDFQSTNDLMTFTNAILKNFTAVDVIINNASITGDSNLSGFSGELSKEFQTTETFNEVFIVGVTAPFVIIRELHPLLLNNINSSIINISSIYGMVGLTKSIYQEFKMPPAAYAAAKGALISMTKYFATTLAPKIRVNCVAPGGILRSQPDEFIKKYSEVLPLQRMALEKDVVDTIAWISSDKASYLTGQVIAVDGGWTAK